MRIYLPGDAGYDALRKPLRADIDPYPAMVMQAEGAADIRTAILTARDKGLPLAVQATGHGTHQAADGAVLLKTTEMAHVLVDPDRGIAKVGPGAVWGQVLKAAQPFGLAPLSGSSPTVGVTGYSVGGGVGWLARKFGFAADSIIKAKVVTADGRLLTVSADQYPDLFWAIRGGGGNFGIVAGLEIKLFPVAKVYAGTATIDGDVTENLAAYRDWALSLPDEMSTAAIVKDHTVIVKMLSTTKPAPLWTDALENTVRKCDYADASMGGTAARYFDYFETLTDEAIQLAVANHEENGSTIEIRHWGGAMAETGPDKGPVGHRSMSFSLILDNPATPPTGTNTGFLNFTADPARTDRAFTDANRKRLATVKKFYDPNNFFHLNSGYAAGQAPSASTQRRPRTQIRVPA
jgi:FAD/FMN-containing dehydrogenase